MEANTAPIALCNALYNAYPLSRFFENLSNVNCSHIALYGVSPHIVIDHYSYREEAVAVKILATANQVAIDCFIPHNYGYSVFAEQGSETYAASLNYYSNCIRATAELGASVLCLRPQNGLLSQDKGILILNAVSLMSKLLKVAERYNVRIALATGNYPGSAALNTLPEMAAFINTFNSHLLGVLLDTHVLCACGETVQDWINEFNDKIYYVFLSDGRAGGYRAWGNGVYPMDNFTSLLIPRYAGKICYFLPANDEKVPDPYPEKTDLANISALCKVLEAVQ